MCEGMESWASRCVRAQVAQLRAAGEADRARAEALAAQATRLQRELEAAAMERDAARAATARVAVEGQVRWPVPARPRALRLGLTE